MSESNGPIVQTEGGAVRGFMDGDVFTFKGIPYGEAERFMAPRPASWVGVRDAFEYGPTSVQPARRNPSITGPLMVASGEDCLVLNVWTRGLGDGGKRPVMFWIHGGGFSTGSASGPLVHGANIVRRGDIVMVGVNHRLGALGHLYLADLDERFPTSGINSFLDLVRALEWVRENIEAFGGDPDNVTIFGESGGGGKVATLMTMPAAVGLFKRAIIQSGIKSNNDRGRPTVFGKHGLTIEQAAHFRSQVLGKLGLGEADFERLLELPAQDIANAQGDVEAENLVLGPVIDGEIMPRHPFDPDVVATASDIPLIIGANGDEWFNYIAAKPHFKGIDWDGVVQWSVDWNLDRATAERITADFRKLYPDASPEDLLTTICSDHMIRVPSVRIADLRSQQGTAPVYHYAFTFDSPVSGKSVHALDIPFVFDNAAATPLTGEGDDRFDLAARMSNAWIAFARTGNPNHEGLPEWPVYEPSSRQTMVFDLETRVEGDYLEEQNRIWDGVL